MIYNHTILLTTGTIRNDIFFKLDLIIICFKNFSQHRLESKSYKENTKWVIIFFRKGNNNVFKKKKTSRTGLNVYLRKHCIQVGCTLTMPSAATTVK